MKEIRKGEKSYKKRKKEKRKGEKYRNWKLVEQGLANYWVGLGLGQVNQVVGQNSYFKLVENRSC